MAETKRLLIELPIEIADQLEQKAAEAKLPLQAIAIGQLFSGWETTKLVTRLGHAGQKRERNQTGASQ